MFRKTIREVDYGDSYIKIKAGSIYGLPIFVESPKTVIQWCFRPVYYDIDFQITRESKNNELDDILPLNHYPGDTASEGKQVAEEPGVYYLVWDNRMSWLREKTVVYSVKLVLPDNGMKDKIECASYLQNRALTLLALSLASKVSLFLAVITGLALSKTLRTSSSRSRRSMPSETRKRSRWQ